MDQPEEKIFRERESDWIYLTDPHLWSRLLYPNPVCFLCTATNCNNGTLLTPDSNFVSSMTGTSTCTFMGNVMVLSWLTATNNQGGFMFSLNKRRYTSSLLVSSPNHHAIPTCDAHENQNNSMTYSNDTKTFFTLSVPVHGMEELVLAVGKVSGRWGSKFMRHPCFPSTHVRGDESTHTIAEYTQCRNPSIHTYERESVQETDRSSMNDASIPSENDRSHNEVKRSQKKKCRTTAIPGLMSVPLGHCSKAGNEPCSFAIDGTVAHMKCQVKQVLSNVIDQDHLLILADIQEAYVHSNYWDGKRFFPTSQSTPPYLTFLGSQTFGHVVSLNMNPQTM